ncbi:transglutaminase domain-containing protein [Clostridium sp. YIM B02505]|uniref:Transglutaminase domain-containing protein n=1 Tax=Clostridium yunnanense TaxID=2800325 RepID=A0ABS1EJ05_9CLOT|nr:transglutaminase-like domain-containing protein [Clostridium yunnanense]MBK1809293.1 transglutaminase domain-containing protein [Clostridium yunnanense]
MNFNTTNLILIAVFVIPVIAGFVNKFSSEDAMEEILDIEKSIALFLSIVLAVIYCSKQELLPKIVDYLSTLSDYLDTILNGYRQISYYAVFLIIIYLVYNIIFIIIRILNKLTVQPFIDILSRYSQKKGNVFRGFIGAIFALPRAIIFLIVICISLNFVSYLNFPSEVKKSINGSAIYKTISKNVINPITTSPIVKEIPRVLNDSLKIKVVKVDENQNSKSSSKSTNAREVVYYNGVTLEQGIKSNETINQEALKLTRFKSSDKEKAKSLYAWIGTNIEYDDNKANEILSNNFRVQSGAIPTYETRTGICFDYSCLYVAMARAANLKVRLVIGQGYNGEQWVNHAWNEVYLKEENRWITVDTTFYKAGSYFDSKRFYNDHKIEKVAGEW